MVSILDKNNALTFATGDLGIKVGPFQFLSKGSYLGEFSKQVDNLTLPDVTLVWYNIWGDLQGASNKTEEKAAGPE